MYTNGFVPVASDAVTIGTLFSGSIAGKTQNVVASYITVGSTGAGDIVWKNQYGDLNWLPGVVAGQTYVLGAVEIVSSGIVNGVSRTTTASALVWWAINSQSNF